MTPLLFPHTFVSDDVRKAILGVFDSMAFFEVLKHPEDSDPRIWALFPAPGIEDRVGRFLAENTSGAGLFTEKASSFLKGRGGVPLLDPDGIPFIRSAVVKGIEGETGSGISQADWEERVFRSAVFLQMARDYDQQNQEIDRELEIVFSREKKLFEMLLGDDDIAELRRESGMALSQPVPPDLSADMNIELRISAWANLLVHADPASGAAMDGFYLTTRKLVIEHLQEHAPQLVRLGMIKGCLDRNKDFTQILHDIVVCEDYQRMPHLKKSFEEMSSGLEIYIAPDISPGEFFSRFTEKGEVTGCEKSLFRNTVIGFFKM